MNRPAFVLWFTGLSGAGKSTLAEAVARELERRGVNHEVLDGDVVRENLSKGLSFSKDDRDINVRRIGWVARTLARHGCIAICAAISPYRAIRDEIRAASDAFVEVYIQVTLDVAEGRDVKGLYARARAGEIPNFTGIDDPYEEPLTPEIVCSTADQTVEQSAAHVIAECVRLGHLS